MQLPDQLLSADIPSFCKTVLSALWRRAEGEPPWTAMRIADLVEATRSSMAHVKRALALLRTRGAVRRETHDVAGRPVLGFGLSRAVLPLQRKVSRTDRTTLAGGLHRVVKREKTRTLTIADDLMSIAKVAMRGDSELRIAEELRRRGIPCSGTGARGWYPEKVHRRVAMMRAELGPAKGAGGRAGDIAQRWKAVAEARARAERPQLHVTDAQVDFSGESHHHMGADEGAREQPKRAHR